MDVSNNIIAQIVVNDQYGLSIVFLAMFFLTLPLFTLLYNKVYYSPKKQCLRKSEIFGKKN